MRGVGTARSGSGGSDLGVGRESSSPSSQEVGLAPRKETRGPSPRGWPRGSRWVSLLGRPAGPALTQPCPQQHPQGPRPHPGLPRRRMQVSLGPQKASRCVRGRSDRPSVCGAPGSGQAGPAPEPGVLARGAASAQTLGPGSPGHGGVLWPSPSVTCGSCTRPRHSHSPAATAAPGQGAP